MNAKLLKQISDNLTPLDTEELYANMLDEVYPDCEIAGMTFQTSRALKELDPTAFRCGMVDYIDSLSLIEIQGDYYEQDAVETERDSLVDDLESELSDLEDEISEYEDEEPIDAEDAKEILAQIETRRSSVSDLKNQIEEIKKYTF